MLSTDEIRNLLSYDPQTGVFVWRISTSPKAQAGANAGCRSGKYWRIGIGGRPYPAHRLAWLYMNGEFPDGEIDHVNGDCLDNRIVNLRAVSHLENMRNSPLRSDNSHGVPGVYLNPRTGRWYAQSCHGGKNKHIGSFDSLEAAAAARSIFQDDNGYHQNHGRTATALVRFADAVAGKIAEKEATK